MEVVAEERVVAWPQHHGDLVVLWGQFLLAMEVLCLKPEIQCVVSGDSQFLAGLCLGCKRKGAGRSRLYQSYQEPGVELGEEVGLPFLSSVASKAYQVPIFYRAFPNLVSLGSSELELVFSNFSPCHRLLFLLLTGRGEKQLIHKLKS